MIINQQVLKRLMALAKLEFSSLDEEAMLQDLNKIGTWIEKLQEIDTTNVLPLTSMSSEENIVREDVGVAALSSQQGLMNAPRSDANYFRVPQVKNV